MNSYSNKTTIFGNPEDSSVAKHMSWHERGPVVDPAKVLGSPSTAASSTEQLELHCLDEPG